MKSTVVLFFLLTLSSRALAQEPITKLDTTNSQISAVFDVEAEFPGGMEALNKFIQDNINLMEVIEFSDKEMYNKVHVRFLVTKDGSIENADILKAGAYCPPCNKEALRVVNSMPKWHPALRDGKPTATFVRLPIIFSIQ